MKEKKVKKKGKNYPLIAISTAAIGAIYSAGYIVTELPDDFQNSIETSQSFQVENKSIKLTTKGEPIIDGQYSGVGRSRFGNLQLLLTIKQGEIISAIFGWITTSYPSSKIAPMLDQIVLKQGKDIDLISGATASAQALRNAVRDAFKSIDDGDVTVAKVKAPSPFYDYKNGIYKTEIEDYEVKIKVEEGKINSVAIQWYSPFNTYTEYMDIIFERVEGQVIELQNSKIDLWAGATDSMEIVHEALEILIEQAKK